MKHTQALTRTEAQVDDHVAAGITASSAAGPRRRCRGAGVWCSTGERNVGEEGVS